MSNPFGNLLMSWKRNLPQTTKITKKKEKGKYYYYYFKNSKGFSLKKKEKLRKQPIFVNCLLLFILCAGSLFHFA